MAATPVNRARGESLLAVPGVGEFKLCLTLGAIAEIEDGLGVENLAQIEQAINGAGSRTFGVILSALARGGGHDVKVDDVRRWPLTVQEALAAIVAAFRSAGAMSEAAEGEAAAGN